MVLRGALTDLQRRSNSRAVPEVTCEAWVVSSHRCGMEMVDQRLAGAGEIRQLHVATQGRQTRTSGRRNNLGSHSSSRRAQEAGGGGGGAAALVGGLREVRVGLRRAHAADAGGPNPLFVAYRPYQNPILMRQPHLKP